MPKLPIYKRQQFLLAFIQQLCGSATETDLQKLVFVYSMENDAEHYSFVPYKFGAYSFQLAQDLEILESHHFISKADNRIYALNSLLISGIDALSIEVLRGKSLIRKTYKEYAYYAMNSEIAEELLNQAELQKIENIKKQLTQTEQILFTIGYESKTVEKFINTLIKKDIRLLCDIRRNPLSRKFGFSKDKLKHILETVGIKYIHIPELGIESHKRANLHSKADYDFLFEEYRQSLSVCTGTLEYLYSILLLNKRIALMCYELDPMLCHRKQIENYMREHYNVHSEDI